MKEKDCRSYLSRKIKLVRFFRDMDQKDKEEIRRLDDEHKRRIAEMDTSHLDNLRVNILNRRYELDHHVVSLTPDLWSIDILIDEEYRHYRASKAIDDIMSQDEKPKRRFKSRKEGKFRPFVL